MAESVSRANADAPELKLHAAGGRLPPGPRWPRFIVAVAYMTVGRRFMRVMNARFDGAFTLQLPLFGPTVTITDPGLAKELYQQPRDAVQGVDANLGMLLGPSSSFALQGEKHLRHRKILLPPFHGGRVRAYEQLIERETRNAIAGWPEDVEFAVLPTTMRITLDTILRAIFGAEDKEFDDLRSLMPRIVELGQRIIYLPWLRRDLGAWSPGHRFREMRAELDRIMASLIAKALADPDLAQRTDVLALLLQSRYGDGTPMSHADITDELFTMVVAGHETTATELAWAFERIRRHPDVLDRLVTEVDAGESALLRATVAEVLRTRPVIDGSGRKVVAPSITLGQWTIPQGYTVAVNLSLTNHNPHTYDDPESFSPDRFVGTAPSTYSWLPFGGGNRRCLGAMFAQMEMEVVLRTILDEFELIPTKARPERLKPKGVVTMPGRGGLISVRRRKSVS